MLYLHEHRCCHGVCVGCGQSGVERVGIGHCLLFVEGMEEQQQGGNFVSLANGGTGLLSNCRCACMGQVPHVITASVAVPFVPLRRFAHAPSLFGRVQLFV